MMRRWLLILIAGCCAAGCQPRPASGDPPPADAAAALRARLGRAEALHATLLLRWKPPDGEAVLFTLHLWATPDGRGHLLAQKLDVAFLEVWLDAANRFTAVLPRTGEVARGGLDALGRQAPLLLTDLRLLMAEAREGPLATAAWAPDGDGRLRSPGAGKGGCLVVLGADGMPTAKEVLADDGSVSRQLDYKDWRGWDGIWRPARIGIAVAGDAGEYLLRVKTLDPLPGVSDERMAVRLPAAVREVELDAFLRALESQ